MSDARNAMSCAMRPARLMLGVLLPWMMGACSLDGLLKSNVLPGDVTDPALTKTPAGAQAAYNGALRSLQDALGPGAEGNFVAVTGVISDELSGRRGTLVSPIPYIVNLRQLSDGPESEEANTQFVFARLNTVRQQARQARGLLSDYIPEEPALRAHLYAIEGYAEVMLAELFCSGIPLSTIDYNGDYTLQPGSSTEEVFTHAEVLFDSALALAGDSARIANLSRVGRARALLGLDDYAGALASVAAVPDTFRYLISYRADSSRGLGFYSGTSPSLWLFNGVADREGSNGLPYRSSNDPRTRVTLLDDGFYHPDKFTLTGADTIVLASGVEARLIAAEDALHRGDAGWLDTLNHLRETAIAPALPDTTDPGSDSARVSLLFRERAFWLFLTGHRQGDMRRLVRQYNQYGFTQDVVYPVGVSEYGGVYGSYVDVPVPWTERQRNPLFTGCRSRD